MRARFIENCSLLGRYAARSGNFLPTFRDKLSVNPEDGTDRSSRNDARNYHHSLRSNLEEHSSPLLHGGSLKSRAIYEYLLIAVLFGGVPVRFVSKDIVMVCLTY